MKVELLRDLDRDTGWVLLVDGVEQSYVDVGDPTHLEFEYMQHMAVIIDAVFERPRPRACVHLGGGACALPRWLAATRPGSQQLVIEASAEVLAAVEPLGPVPDCRIVLDDAVAQLSLLPRRSAEVVVWDLYAGPRAVTSSLQLQAIAAMAELLRAPHGVLLLNVSDATPFTVVRPVVAALLTLFDDVAVLAEPSTLRGRRSGNCVLVGSLGRLPEDVIRRMAARAFTRARVLTGAGLREFVGDSVPPTADAPLPEPDEILGRGFL